ncbi:PadR family transcriptional regulator [Paenibacillus sp. 1001270B_150601_E10]|uniref:PadR family transcriptional regulator n=1 Tax=Paenibacillus sp. 1001270B_150601_E10 TaxID=2787079 RepID=UPI00189E78F3|nr:PadR family transcriptional regulator [Paenibacillus sp. 1001270B_150601_E10]
MSINKELMKGSTTILILNLLEKQPMYGYEMTKEMERLSNGLFMFKEGTLYPILHALESDGSIEAYWEMKDGRKRKYYMLLDRGRQQLAEKKQEWRLFRTTVDQVLGEG